jgi:hypothetical protein
MRWEKTGQADRFSLSDGVFRDIEWAEYLALSDGQRVPSSDVDFFA